MSRITIFQCTKCDAVFFTKPVGLTHHEMRKGADDLAATGEFCDGKITIKGELNNFYKKQEEDPSTQ
jgi:hypothetical protein